MTMNLVSVLACPVFFPPQLLVAVPVFMATGALLPFLLLYRLYWQLMYGAGPLLGQGIRLQGRVLGPGIRGRLVYGRDHAGRLHAEPFFLGTGDGMIVVAPMGALLRGRPRRVQVGSRVTVDGTPDVMTLSGEQHYREASSCRGMKARQITLGAPPSLARITRWTLGIGLASLAVIVATLLFV